MKSLTATSGTRTRIFAAVMAVLLVFALLPVFTIPAKAANYYTERGMFDWSDANKGPGGYDEVILMSRTQLNGYLATGMRPTKFVLGADIIFSATANNDMLSSAANSLTLMFTNSPGNNYFIGFATKLTGYNANWGIFNFSGTSVDLYLENVTIKNATRLATATSGSTIEVSGANSKVYVLSGTSFYNNGPSPVAFADRGSIVVGSTGEIIVQGTNIKFSENVAKGGGALYSEGKISIINEEGNNPITFINNEAKNSIGGGAIYITNFTNLYISPGVIFSGNFSPGGTNQLSVSEAIYREHVKVSDYYWSDYKYPLTTGAAYTFRYGLNGYDISASGIGTTYTQPPKIVGEDSIVIHKYQIDKMENAGKPTGTDADEADVLANNDHIIGTLTGVPFTIYQVQNLFVWKGSGAVSLDFSDTEHPTITIGDYTYNLVVPKGKTTANSVGETNNLGTLHFDELFDGVYLVVEGGYSGLMKAADPFLINLPMPDTSDPDTLIKMVHVYPKNELLRIIKSSDASMDRVDPSENITYKIKIEKPYNFDDLDTFILTDELQDALLFQGVGTVMVSTYFEGGQVHAPVSGTTLSALTGISGKILTVDLSPDKMGVFTEEYDEILVTFKVQIDPGIKDIDIIPNTAVVKLNDFGVSSNEYDLIVRSNFELPHTGGEGLIILTIVGVVIVGGGAAWMLLRKKKREE